MKRPLSALVIAALNHLIAEHEPEHADDAALTSAGDHIPGEDCSYWGCWCGQSDERRDSCEDCKARDALLAEDPQLVTTTARLEAIEHLDREGAPVAHLVLDVDSQMVMSVWSSEAEAEADRRRREETVSSRHYAVQSWTVGP